MDKVCEGCGRHWSDPIPANCPRCGEMFWVMEETSTVESDPEITGEPTTTGSTTTTGATYYCDRCDVVHSISSGIGKRHMPVSGTS